MKIIGITGGSGSGKSLFCGFLAELGAAVIDADEIAHRVIKRGGAAFDETVSAFGSGILDENGEIDRKRLGKIVFSDQKKLSLLNEITHRHIFREMSEEARRVGDGMVLLDVPLLFADDFPIKCDLSVAVIAQHEVRISRIAERDGISKEDAAARIASQMSDEETAARADICVDNSRGIDELKAKAARIYNIIKP